MTAKYLSHCRPLQCAWNECIGAGMNTRKLPVTLLRNKPSSAAVEASATSEPVISGILHLLIAWHRRWAECREASTQIIDGLGWRVLVVLLLEVPEDLSALEQRILHSMKLFALLESLRRLGEQFQCVLPC